MAGRSGLENTEADLLEYQFSHEPATWPHKWGWVVYRAAYAPELDAAWTNLEQRVRDATGTYVDHNTTGEEQGLVPFPQYLAEKQDFVFVSDPAVLEGVSFETLRAEHFQPWARGEAAGVEDHAFRGARYNFYLVADGEALRSVAGDAAAATEETGRQRFPPFVNFVQGWVEDGDGFDDDGEDGEGEGGGNWDDGPMDRVKVALSQLAVSSYTELNAPEMWYEVMKSAQVHCTPIRN